MELLFEIMDEISSGMSLMPLSQKRYCLKFPTTFVIQNPVCQSMVTESRQVPTPGVDTFQDNELFLIEDNI